MTNRKIADGRNKNEKLVERMIPESNTITYLMITLWSGIIAAVMVDTTIAQNISVFPDWVRDAAQWISRSTDPLFVIPLIAGAFVVQLALRAVGFASRHDLIKELLIQAIAAIGVATLLKTIIGRARPSHSAMDPFNFQPFMAQDMFASCPSAQATLAAAIGFSFAMRFPSARMPILMAAAAVCLSRVLVGEHWSSDVVFGWALGWYISSMHRRSNA
ncbi:phosphatase PAP2 family protein [Endobacterium cereale]|uniref:phosphatase PAP2 family protein n=1 Tax=Endobacterium cereale TaxID=2663029 RepID=UPI002B46E86E|nr:phosphatase PAP2 family protein [Endobacterium cereale]MEB2848475.1 phosphatase PAP2 family protein [Endobacterium cereale]